MSEEFAVYLRDMRQQAGWIVNEATRRTGISPSRRHDLESGEARATGRPTGPSRANCERIALAFGVPVELVLARAGYWPEAKAASGADELELLTVFRCLPGERRQEALKILRVLAGLR